MRILDENSNMSAISKVKINKLKQWRKPIKYRSIVAFNPRGIYQVDIMHLYPLWTKVFSDQDKTKYELNNYPLVCVDVYSRYVKSRAIPSTERKNIAKALFELISIMGKPNYHISR
jgi:hypothetical protein